MDYMLPIVPKNPNTAIWIKGYEIKNRTAFHFKEKDSKEGSMTLELTFFSNDYSTQKYQNFIDEFIKFLDESGYTQGK